MGNEDLKVWNFNQDCSCQTFEPSKLKKQLLNYKKHDLLIDEILRKRPNLFSSTMLFINLADYLKIESTIKTIEKVIKLTHTASQEESSGVFMGYDFHLTQQGPRLIEINTNAGGAFLNLELAKSQIQCVTDDNQFFNEKRSLEELHEIYFRMFINEWRMQRADQQLKTIAIVDRDPKEQFLYPEFLLFQELFEAHSIECIICDSSSLTFENNKLMYKNIEIDLVYNRLTDFYLTDPTSMTLLQAYQHHSIVLTPSPHHFQTHANKINLTYLTDEAKMNNLNITDEDKETLRLFIPKTVIVNESNLDVLWKNRKSYFFKPFIGYGSKATYRGDKITTRVWDEICDGDYVAQELAPPSKKIILQDGNKVEAKVDVRAYVYQGEIQLMAARLYEGQTTNFRTPGGGFAPVFVMA
jgi:hypothetical protein